MEKYDAIIVGSGPNGFAAAITLQQRGLKTLLLEGGTTIGGGMRSKALTLPGFLHDVCAAVHPMAMASPFFRSLPLEAYGLGFTYAPYEAAHPLDDADTVFLKRDLTETANALEEDAPYYQKLMRLVAHEWELLADDIMGPLRIPNNPMLLAKFGLTAVQPADAVARRFKTKRARALWGGMAAHGIQPLSNYTTAAIGMVLSGVGHRYGWPIPIGGSQAIADALAAYYKDLGGKIQTDFWVRDIKTLPEHKVLVLDLTPRQLLALDGLDLSPGYSKQLNRYRQGMGVFKIDWALSEPIPYRDRRCLEASTVHLGNTYEEIAANEERSAKGEIVERPFVLLTQPSLFDANRAPAGKHTAWAYCHVPNGSLIDRTNAIEMQVERFAPGFRDVILERSTLNTREMEDYNPNYVGGDINGGIMDLFQLYTRPTRSLTPYRTSNKHVYICSSATPPGGGVHGMSGFHAAQTVLRDHFKDISA